MIRTLINNPDRCRFSLKKCWCNLFNQDVLTWISQDRYPPSGCWDRRSLLRYIRMVFRSRENRKGKRGWFGRANFFARCFKVLFTKGIEHFVNEKGIIDGRIALMKSSIIPAPICSFSKRRSDNLRQIGIENQVDGFAGVSSLLHLDRIPVYLVLGLWLHPQRAKTSKTSKDMWRARCITWKTSGYRQK